MESLILLVELYCCFWLAYNGDSAELPSVGKKPWVLVFKWHFCGHTFILLVFSARMDNFVVDNSPL